MQTVEGLIRLITTAAILQDEITIIKACEWIESINVE